MDQNRDWKPIAALVLAGLALFVALSGPRGWGHEEVRVLPPQIAFESIAPEEFKAPAMPEGKIILPPVVDERERQYERMWAGWGHDGGFKGWFILPFVWLLLLGGLIFLAVKMFRRRGWGGPGWYGGPGGGPGPGPQGPPNAPQYQQPYQQYPPQYPPQYQQPYQQYPPQYGQGQAQQPNQGAQVDDAHGDITKPEGSGQ